MSKEWVQKCPASVSELGMLQMKRHGLESRQVHRTSTLLHVVGDVLADGVVTTGEVEVLRAAHVGIRAEHQDNLVCQQATMREQSLLCRLEDWVDRVLKKSEGR